MSCPNCACAYCLSARGSQPLPTAFGQPLPPNYYQLDCGCPPNTNCGSVVCPRAIKVTCRP